jgi:hypothetical protein
MTLLTDINSKLRQIDETDLERIVSELDPSVLSAMAKSCNADDNLFVMLATEYAKSLAQTSELKDRVIDLAFRQRNTASRTQPSPNRT